VTISPAWRRIALLLVSSLIVVATFAPSSGAVHVYRTTQLSMLTLHPTAPLGSSLLAIINSGETPASLPGFMFEGIPDGIGAMPGPSTGTVDVFVNHEQSHVPFGGFGDLVDASVSKLTLDTTSGDEGVLAASVPIPSGAGYLRFCSSTMAGPPEGLDRYLYFTNEESNDVVPVPAGAPYGPDPSLDPMRQAGYSVVLDPATGAFTQVPGMGRHNHENTMVVPGGWNRIAVLSGDDTFFSSPLPDWSQLYLYLVGNEDALLADLGSLWAFRVTKTDEGPVNPNDPFNGANDYGDIQSGDAWRGRFIRVPPMIARGLTSESPQDALENWSNDHNVFQFIRVEDTAYDRTNPRVVYIADTGDRRMVPDPATGRLTRGPSGTSGAFPNGRIYRMEFSAENPRKVDSFSILLNGDTGEPGGTLGPIFQPDNVGTSPNSLMVQEDTSQTSSRVWRYDFATAMWSIVATVNDPDWESSGIVDVSEWFGPGSWLLDVQAHDVFVATAPGPPGVTLKREGGQLLLMKVPGS